MAWDIRRGNWTEPELQLIPYALREGEAALDIGANYGLYSYHLSRALGGRGRVYAFEPVPFTCGTFRLISKVLRFRNVELVPKGCSDKNGQVTFELPLQASGAIAAGLTFLGGRHNQRTGKEQHARFEGTREIRCDVVRIDDSLRDPGELAFVKCDIEGAELLALRGAEKTIEQFAPTVLCEINPWFLEGFGIQLGDLLGFFASRGYELYWFDDSRRKLVARQPDQVVEDNYVFLHPRRRERFAPLLE